MQRIVAFDVGEKRIGIAVSDALGWTAQGLETYVRKNLETDIDYLLAVAARYRPCKLLFGIPRNMDGSYGPQAERTRRFADRLAQKWEGELTFEDERLTTAQARNVLIAADVSRKNRKAVIDKMAASLILQSYLDRIGKRG
ncbi:MAG: Holliday junction resolvase RuvX [Clostridiales bacterium]|nr:Holliday junction resolvase RuvX [Clostridiales bacterium]